MKRKIIVTADGSTTIRLEEWNEQYHSKHGAIQECHHVFIKNGLNHVKLPKISILEIGFGTGLNALMTYAEAQKQKLSINYVGVEAFPVPMDELTQLNYASQLDNERFAEVFEQMHNCPWEEPVPISGFFSLHKQQRDFFALEGENLFNLIYFDAFGPRVQPELWTKDLFSKMFKLLKEGGVLVTYSAKGSVWRAMLEVGFAVERLEGPPGKREMLRATITL